MAEYLCVSNFLRILRETFLTTPYLAKLIDYHYIKQVKARYLI